jgi:alkanesulfonate monooxygenase SsuD/methylene tetrahydromethanopterin reductase-like flavin-dependent oxidoreductase (luciferase family)
VTWSGEFRPSLNNQGIYPRPLQNQLPIWLGVGGTPASFIRAGELGLPLMVAVIGGETYRFKPLVDLYKQAGEKAGFLPEQLKVGLHSLGYVANSKAEAIDDYYPGYAEMFTNLGKERGFSAVTKERFDAQNGDLGALLVDSTEAVAEKIVRHSKALGGISRFTFQMDAGLTHKKLMQSIELIGTKVSPLVKLRK